MRAITAAQQAVIDSGVQSEHVRVSVKSLDSGGVFLDMSTYPGFDAVESVTWGERIDDPNMSCDITFSREFYALSLSPFVAASAVNHAFDPSAAFSALIALNREVKIEVAVMPMDERPASGDWVEVFRGRIDSFDVAKDQTVTVACRGLAGRLAQQFIKTELVYSYAEFGGATIALRVWEPQMLVVAGATYCLPATRGDDDPGLNKFLKCAVGGTTGTSEPIWTAGANQADGATVRWDYVGPTTTAGRPVEEVMQNILDDNRLVGDSSVVLYTPLSPGWAIRQFIQQRTFTLDAIRTLSSQIGWDLRYKWRAATSQFELTFYEPPRTAPVVDRTFTADDYDKPESLALDISQIRNAWRVVYSDAADLYPDGTAKRKVIEVRDEASILKYKELWAEIQEDETSNIDTAAEATTLTAAALSDCAEPTAVFAVALTMSFPWVELNDYYEFQADGVHADSSIKLAVTGWTQGFDATGLKTKLQLRGLPSAGATVHLEKTVHPKNPPMRQPNAHQFVQFQGAKTPRTNFSDVVGGTKITLDVPMKERNRFPPEYEVHIYETPGTPLDNTTLKGLTKGQDLVVPDQIPGRTYYSRIVERSYNAGRLMRGQPTGEVSYVAGRASAGHLHQSVEWGRMPLNGGFEGWLDTGDAPDHWSIEDSGAPSPWGGSNVSRMTGALAVSGTDWVRYTCSVSGSQYLITDKFTIEAGVSYGAAWWKQISTANTGGAIQFGVRWIQWDGTTDSQETVDEIHFDEAGFVVGVWYQGSGVVTAPVNARFAQVYVVMSAIGDAEFDVDSVRFERA